MDLLTAHERALGEFGRRVHAVGDEQWPAPTPCTEWTVHDLVNHLVSEQLWAPWLLRGATLADVGDRFDGDQLGSDPVASWDRAASGAGAAFRQPGALDGQVHTSSGLLPASEYGWQMTIDLAVHAWDLARAVGADERLDEELVQVVYLVLRPQAESWRAAGVFAPAVTVAGSADLQAKLLALAGREPAPKH
ncbi:TIGR03086 family protein [Longimycelium tulufanense]|uniref:TIGR03086 family protein n=1 Tax=Longimycelium tulufanense TaxID=907463 RepID=A0A8J3C8S7_9PSEU|nr:TIGR03086 family metal-binding protein [Longimycelium tulufanense]GGM56432.1 TIGR03086 family protein [Longimycelium tulufanense]